MARLAPLPRGQALVDAVRRMSTGWADWMVSLVDKVEAAAVRVGGVTLTGQSAAIGATAVPTPVLSRGLYRVQWTARITQAATVSSSVTITVAWTDGGVACAISGAALTGNTTATVQSGEVLVSADAATTIRYSTAYASSGATPMAYALAVRVEEVP